MPREASFNDLVTATVAQISANGTAALIYLAISVPLSTVAGYVGLQSAPIFALGIDSMNVAGLAAAFVQLAAVIAVLGMQYWLTAAMLQGGLSVRFDRMLPFFGIYLLGSLGVGLGFLLFIVPGLILLTRWSLIFPIVAAGEVPAMDSFGDSWELTSNSAWPLFFAFVLLVIGAAILSAITGSMASAIVGEGTIPVALSEALVSEMGSIATIAFTVGAYRLLSDNTRELEEVFA